MIRDGSNDEQAPETSPRPSDIYLRSSSADYEAGPSSSSYALLPHTEYVPIRPTGAVTTASGPMATTTSFDPQLLHATQTYSPYASSWNSQIYDPSSATNVAWTMPAWIPSVEHPPRATSRPDTIHPFPLLGADPPRVEQAPRPCHVSRELFISNIHYTSDSSFGQYDESQSQVTAMPSVSLPHSSYYFQGQYPGPH